MKRTAFILAALMLGTTSGVIGETRVQAREIPLAVVAGMARYSLAASPAIMLGGLDPASRRIITTALAGSGDFIPGNLWSRVMAGALQVRHETANSVDTLWFNPLLDSGLVVRWAREGTGWKILAAATVTGEMLRSEASANLIAWPMEGGSLSTSLHSSALKSFAAADVGSWDRLFKGKPEARNVVLRRADQAEKSLIELTSMPGYRDSLLLLRQLLATNDPTASHLPPALMRSLTEMGDAARLSLRPITAFRLTDGWSVALQSPDAPSVVWLASFADPAKGEVALPTSFNVVAIDSTQQEARP